MAAPPPPPPPHGEAPKTTAGGGLPTGKYDIFVIPEHSAGSGFLYLPSLRTNTNSFIAGFASALFMVVLGQSMAPAFQAWWANFQGMGNAGMMLLVIAVGLGAWSLGRQQTSGSPGAGAGASADNGFYPGGGSMPGGGGFSSAGSTPRSAHQGSTPHGGTHSQAPPGGSQSSANKPNGSYQRPPQHHPEPEPEPEPEPKPEPEPEPRPQTYARPQAEARPEPPPQPPPPPPPQPSAAKPKPPETTKNAWEKAREEVRRAEEERKVKQAEDKRRADAAARLKELREKEAKERAAREAERQRREAEEKEKKEREAKEARAKELRERLVREREERRKKLEEEKRLRKEQEESEARKTSSYAYSGVGEKTNPWPAGKPTTASPQAGNPRSTSPSKKPPAPTARSATEDETHSFRPYDQPRRPAGSRVSNSDIQSESSWAPSHSTARTTPPPSVRGAYTTKDPDKIVIKAVYCFMNQYAKTPASQLLSGVGSVTDGLILRITTEGMFIDDDVRGVAQREWDVKAWTLKNVEVWCPVHFLDCAIAANSPLSPSGSTPAANAKPLSTAFFAKTIGGMARLRAAEKGVCKSLTGGDADTYLSKMLACCKASCRLGVCASAFGGNNEDASSGASGSTRTDSTAQTGDWKAKGLHLLRATIRDMDGKRYMFVIGEEEGWKVAVGLQRLRKGSQVRSLAVAGLSGIDTRNTLEMLGWGG